MALLDLRDAVLNYLLSKYPYTAITAINALTLSSDHPLHEAKVEWQKAKHAIGVARSRRTGGSADYLLHEA